MQPDDKIVVRCECGKSYRVDASRAGRRACCKVCGAEMLIPVEVLEVQKQPHAMEDVGGFNPDALEDELSALASAASNQGTYAEQVERRRARRPKKSWIDKQFADTNIVLIIIIAVFGCCSCVIFPFSIVGLILCKDPVARRNALILFIAHLFWLIAGVMANLEQVM